MNTVKQCYYFGLFFVLVIFVNFGESSTPFTAYSQYSTKPVTDLDIEGCTREYCNIREDTPYNIKFNLTAPFRGFMGGQLQWAIIDEKTGKAVRTRNMLKFCDYLGQNHCPLKELQQVTYSSQLQVVSPLKLWNNLVIEGQRKIILRIGFNLKSNDPFHMDVKVELVRCWPLCF